MWRVHCTDLQNQRSQVEVRIPYAEGLTLQRELFETSEERVVLAKIAAAQLKDRYVLLVKALLPVPPEEYVTSKFGTSWKASFNFSAIENASGSRSGLLILHSHCEQSPPRLSSIDLKNGTQLCAAFRTAIPNMPHGTAVFGEGGSINGLAWIPGKNDPIPITRSRWISDPVRTLPAEVSEKNIPNAMYARQLGLIGENGQRLLAGATVGVVGLGGGGSHVVQQLSLLGVGTIVGVDRDVIEESNRSRLIGGRPSDVKTKMSKVKIMERQVDDTNP